MKEELSIVYSLPYATDLVGTAWEQILSDVKAGVWTQKRDNRPPPDFYVMEGERKKNYSVKTEALRPTAGRIHAADFLGGYEDLIVARPKVDELLESEETIETLSADQLGAKVLQYYNEQIVRRYDWHVISILLRIEGRHFIYWEESPPPIYDPGLYWWKDSGRATGSNRNINGFANDVPRSLIPLPRAKFKWTSGGKQFYVLYRIPENSDTWTIDPAQVSEADVRRALRNLLRERRKNQGLDEPT